MSEIPIMATNNCQHIIMSSQIRDTIVQIPGPNMSNNVTQIPTCKKLILCMKCNKSFSSSHCLRKHLRNVCGREKRTYIMYPRQCLKCLSYFKDNQSYQSHSKQHKKCISKKDSPIQCDVPVRIEDIPLSDVISCDNSTSIEPLLPIADPAEQIKLNKSRDGSTHPEKEQDCISTTDIKVHRTFGTMNAFLKWKEAIEHESQNYFSKKSGTSVYKNKKYIYYTCQLNKEEKTHRKIGEPERKTPRKLSQCYVLPNTNCPAGIYVHVSDKMIYVKYSGNHNHEPMRKLLHLRRFPLSKLENVSEQVKLGVPKRSKKSGRKTPLGSCNEPQGLLENDCPEAQSATLCDQTNFDASHEPDKPINVESHVGQLLNSSQKGVDVRERDDRCNEENTFNHDSTLHQREICMNLNHNALHLDSNHHEVECVDLGDDDCDKETTETIRKLTKELKIARKEKEKYQCCP